MNFSVKKTAKKFGLAAFLFFFIKGLIWLAVFFGAAKLLLPENPKPTEIELSVWHLVAIDTNRKTLHFKMIVPETITDSAVIIDYGKHFFQDRIPRSKPLTVTHCPSCNVEDSQALKASIIEKGYVVTD